jgi:endonuclease YncB( thermonuclease family)
MLVVWLDRCWVYPSWTAPTAASACRSTEDLARYHGRTFAVVQVVDGDTLHIDAADGQSATTRVRLLGIDAPEMTGSGRGPAHFAFESSEFAKRLALGKPVSLYLNESGNTRGSYGRLLAYVELPDGIFLNEALIVQGYAYADWRFGHGYYQRYRQLEGSARALGRGLWARLSREDLPAWRQRMLAEAAP